MSKSIWIINHYAGSPIHGMEFRHFYIAKELKNVGYDVSIISSSYSHLYKKIPECIADITYQNIDDINYCWIKVPKYMGNGLKRVINMLTFTYKLNKYKNELSLKKPDVVIASSPHPFVALNGYVISKKHNAKYIFEVRDIWPLTVTELSGFSIYNPFIITMQLIENFAYRNADQVVSLLPKAFAHMKKHYLIQDKFNYIPNGISLLAKKNARSIPDSVKRQLPFNKFIVGYAGGFTKADTLDILLDAAFLLQNYNDLHFVLVGGGVEKNNLLQKASDQKNVTFIDSIPNEMVDDMLSHFDACYIGWKRNVLYQYGVSPNKIFDYMYAAKPIIQAIEAGNDLVAESGCGISVQAENPRAIADACLKMLRLSYNEREEIGKRGRDYILANHDYKVLAKKFLEIFYE